jgi:hypothetical protein
VGAAGVMSRMLSLVHRGGWAKCEVKVVRGADEDADVDVGAAHGAGVDAGATISAVVVVRSARGVGWGARAARGMAIVSEVSTTEEG